MHKPHKRHLRVLLVEDEEIIVMRLLRETSGMESISVDIAATQEEARVKIKYNSFHVVFLDGKVPQQGNASADTFELCTWMLGQGIECIITFSDNPERVQQLLQLGAHGSCEKGSEERVYVKNVHDILRFLCDGLEEAV